MRWGNTPWHLAISPGYLGCMNLAKISNNSLAAVASLTAVASLGAVLVALAACSEEPKSEIKTLETVKAQGAVDAYDSSGSKASKLQAEKAFVALEREIKELEIRVNATTGDKRAEAAGKLAQLRKRESEIRSDFNEAKFNALIQDIKDSVR